MPEPVNRDPITRSMSVAMLVSVFILMLTVAWSLYDEFFGLRPWRDYQRTFISDYEGYLNHEIARQKKSEDAVYGSAEYKQLRSALDSASAAAAPLDRQIQQQLALLEEQRAAMTPAFQDARGKVGALIYRYEIVPATDQSSKASQLKDLNEAKAGPWKVEWPLGGRTETRSYNYDQINQLFADLMAQKADLVNQQGQADQPVKEAQDKLNDFVKAKLPGLSADALEGLRNGARSFRVDLKQINVNPSGTMINYLGGIGLVDRCQSCHIATDPQVVPITMRLTKVDLGLARSQDAPFGSHPDPELFAWHPLERFGCSPCHGGNGRALDSVERAHGRYEHWLWPLNYPENYDAGCQTCHAADMVTEHAEVLNHGRQLYRVKGCVGCHKYAGFDDETDRLNSARQQITQLESQKADDTLEIPRLNAEADAAPDNATAQTLYQRATNLTVASSKIEGQIEQLDELTNALLREAKRVGPDLKEIRMKLRKEWIPVWLAETHTFRPTTKMPQFRLQPEEIQAIAAYVWQNAITSGITPPHQEPGDAARGRQLLEQRGCLACHSLGEGTNQAGGDFAANLSRIGEKENYDYLVRWIENPRTRTRPYSPSERRDLGPEDYAKHGLPFVFDLDHSKSPDDGHELEVEQPTVMPSMRLSDADARDIASFLMTQKHADAQYPSPQQVAFMDDPKLVPHGKELIQHYGCAGCHEIAGLEEEGKIGTELTNEGSKPIERLDFALYTEDAKRGVPIAGQRHRGLWYDQKGFFEAKLTNPAVFDNGKYKPDPMDRLRMPSPTVNKEDIDALTTFLLGSVDPQMPPEYMYRPADQRKAIQQGWWIVTKYNCIGCHQIDVGQKTVVQDLPWYQGENKANLPPALTSEGARVNPEWLKQFLSNPSLSLTDTHRNGVRSYLQIRMPTFYLSDDEIRKLVLFFEALSWQAQPYIPQKVAPLSAEETSLARALFTNPAAPCLKCHATGDPNHDKNATAPNFLLAGSRLREPWTVRWVTDPAKIIPGTAMPSGLFHKLGDRWVFSGKIPAEFSKYAGDQADLMVRYLLEITPEEQRRLQGSSPKATASASSARPPAE